MLTLVIDVMAFLLTIAAMGYFMYRVLPEMGKRAALCMLHNLRDRIYRVQFQSSFGEDSLLFQDMLFSLTLLIYLVREQPRRAAAPLLAKILGLSGSSTSEDAAENTWRFNRYDYEQSVFFGDENGKKALNSAMTAFREKDIAIALYLFTSHPIIFVSAISSLGVMTLLVIPLVWLRKVYLRSSADIKGICKTLDTIRVHQQSPATRRVYA